MKLIPFNSSAQCTLGIELELQILHPRSGSLVSRAKEFIRRVSISSYLRQIKPEITQSMIEINSLPHFTAVELLDDLLQVKNFMVQEANELNIGISGGGTHPYQMWKHRKIFPSNRFRNLSRQYGYLAKRYTVFGQHIHLGCENGDDAIYLTHAFARYLPQLIALSASSPFYQGIDTAFDSSRVNVVSAFPTNGHLSSAVTTWEEFSVHFNQLLDFKIIESIKDIYWDIRPKVEYGTVEIRICDTPLTMEKAVMLAAYIQTLGHYLLHEKPALMQTTSYEHMLYNYNRYQASRYGFDGVFIDPFTLQHHLIGEDILSTIKILEPHTTILNNGEFIAKIFKFATAKHNDAKWLRETYKKTASLRAVACEQSRLWMS